MASYLENEVITSKKNQKIVDAKRLLDKKYRDKNGQFIVETAKVILEAIKCGVSPICFFVLKDKIFDFLADKNYEIYSVAESVFKELSTNVSPDGIIAIFKKNEEKKQYISGNFLVLDSLQDPQNLGAILRTASATNFRQIFAINCVDEYNPKTIRSSMGNQFKEKICHIGYEDLDKLFKGANLFVASMEGDNILDLKRVPTNVGLVIGNEGNGISNQIREYIKATISLPMENDVESLNAAVSASVIMYYIYSKTRKNK